MQAAEAMAAGDLSQPVRVQGTAEVEALAAAFDQMRASLQAHIEAQRRWGQELEAQVSARTRELEALCRVRDRLVVKLLSAQEEERQRVARELHDETSQVLANLVVALGTMARLTPDVDMRQRLSQVKRQAIETLEGVKRIVLDLRPRLLDDYGLLPAIQWYVEERLGQAG
jgi:signal transduction histidine kinase